MLTTASVYNASRVVLFSGGNAALEYYHMGNSQSC